jgi:hypothetical protein
MIDFALANKLKEAGFPQGGDGRWTVDPEQIVARDRAYVPTLEELIEACGGQLWSIVRLQLADVHGHRWIARDAIIDDNGDTPAFHISGRSPQEAVARLWLILNKTA